LIRCAPSKRSVAEAAGVWTSTASTPCAVPTRTPSGSGASGTTGAVVELAGSGDGVVIMASSSHVGGLFRGAFGPDGQRGQALGRGGDGRDEQQPHAHHHRRQSRRR